MIDRPPLQVPEQIEYNTMLINIENMYDEHCIGWTLRYITLISRLAETCQCGEKTCLYRKLAGDDICSDLKLDEPTRDYKPEKWPSLVCNNPTPGLLETTTIPPLHTCIHITSIPEGSYKCEKFAVSKLGKRTIVIYIYIYRERSVQEYTDFTKTLVYCAITGFAVWQVLCKTWKHIDKSTSPVSAGPTAAVPTAPVSTPTSPSLFKKTPDPFEMK